MEEESLWMGLKEEEGVRWRRERRMGCWLEGMKVEGAIVEEEGLWMDLEEEKGEEEGDERKGPPTRYGWRWS